MPKGKEGLRVEFLKIAPFCEINPLFFFFFFIFFANLPIFLLRESNQGEKMDINKSCKRCGQEAQKVGHTYVCSCGWSVMASNSQKLQKSVIASLFIIALIVGGVLFHSFQWGKHSFSIFFAQGEQRVDICMDLKKYDCVETSYWKLFQNTTDLAYLENLAEIQFKREKYLDSKNNYHMYFDKGGKSFKANYYYAHSLVKNNQLDQAIKKFDSLIVSKPGILMVTVVESYLEVLVNHKRIAKAKKVLAWLEQKNKNSINTKHDIMRWKKRFNI